MSRDSTTENTKTRDTAKDDAAEPRTYRKPLVYVVGKTASLIRGDYGQKDDNYRRYQD